jgi:hypothetical protein
MKNGVSGGTLRRDPCGGWQASGGSHRAFWCTAVADSAAPDQILPPSPELLDPTGSFCGMATRFGRELFRCIRESAGL